jgi:hypothetical protein
MESEPGLLSASQNPSEPTPEGTIAVERAVAEESASYCERAVVIEGTIIAERAVELEGAM